MSKIGNTPIDITQDTSITVDGSVVHIKGPKGEISHTVPTHISVNQDKDKLIITKTSDTRETRALHGLTRSLLANMVQGVNQGYQKRLELVGTGYRVTKQGDKLVLTLGFSHPVEINTPKDISLEVEGNNKITVSGINKQQVGQIAAEIRALKKPEPYKGKGIRYEGEHVRRKPGKAAKVGAAGGE